MKFLKNNWLMLIFLVLGLMLVGKIVYDINEFSEYETKSVNEIKKQCEQNENEQNYEFCRSYFNEKTELMSNNFYYKFNIAYNDTLYYLPVIICLVMYIMTLYNITNIFKSRSAILMLKREKYSSFIKMIFKKFYRYIWFVPLIIVLIFCICAINSNFMVTSKLINNLIMWDENLMKTPLLFCITYLFNIILQVALYLNISMIIARYQHNYFLAVIESFLVTIVLDLFFELVIGEILIVKIMHFENNLLFNIMNSLSFYSTSNNLGVIGLLLFNFILFIISLIIVFMCYRNKENLIINCEKNN